MSFASVSKSTQFCIYSLVLHLSLVTPVFQSTYTSELTASTQTYARICGNGKYHYEAIEINVQENGMYGFKSNNPNKTLGIIYKNDFDPSYPADNLLANSTSACVRYYFQFGIHLHINTTYILVVTTVDPYVQGEFSVFVIGPSNVSLNRTCKFLYLNSNNNRSFPLLFFF